MTIARSFLVTVLLASLFAAPAGIAQEVPAEAQQPAPAIPVLRQNWWAWFEGTPDEVKPRVEAFLEPLNAQLVELSPQNQETATTVIAAVRDNLDLYVSLLGEVEIEQSSPPEPALSYSINDLLQLAASARNARAAANQASVEVEREQRVLDGATRRRDMMFKQYIDATVGDERWLAALRLVRARSAQAIASRRLEVLKQRADNAAAYAEAMLAQTELAQERLVTDDDEGLLEKLIENVDKAASEVAAREELAREAQIAAGSLDVDTADNRSMQRLLQQRALDADVELAAAQIALSSAEALRTWVELKLDADIELADASNLVITWSELVRNTRAQLDDWERQTEDELLAVQGIDRDGLNRAARRVLDQRSGTAAETLGHVGVLDGAIADLEVLMRAVDNAVLEFSGPFGQWLTNVSRSIRTGWLRLTELTEATLFSVGEAPVTTGDIIQAFFILFIGWSISYGIRRAIRRIGKQESAGARASLYTFGRLTHYTIIIVAIFIALTSIGLDFTNLALVAGALSVGIGFGLQSIVNNFVSGLIILFERTLRVGDYIELDNGLTGTVKAINVRSTLINTNDNIDIVVPNSEFVSSRLTNWTLAEHFLRVRIPFGVAYGSDKDLVKKAAMEACEKVPYTLTHMPNREPDVWLVEYGDSSLNFLLLVWVNRQGARRPTRTRAAYLWALEDKLREYGIEIPFPQRDLNMRSGWPVLQAQAAPAEVDNELPQQS